MKPILLIVAFSPLLISPSLAADVIAVPTSTPVTLPVHDADPVFDWSGFYAGVYGAARITDTEAQWGGGIQAGVNAQFDFFLVGAEVSVEGLTGEVGDTAHGQLLGRAGLVAADDVVVYAAGGYGLELQGGGSTEAVAGAGVELAVTQNISVEAQYLHGFSLDGTAPTDTITFGANFHF
jgi:outer membrane immunogenic protein